MIISEKIKEARKNAGLTQNELGERMGISGSAVTQYETGKRVPKIDTLERIADALGMPTWELVYGTEMQETVAKVALVEFSLDTLKILKPYGITEMYPGDTALTVDDFSRLAHAFENEAAWEVTKAVLFAYVSLNWRGKAQMLESIHGLLSQIDRYVDNINPNTPIAIEKAKDIISKEIAEIEQYDGWRWKYDDEKLNNK